MAEKEKRDEEGWNGVANPSILRDSLEAVDNTVLALVAVRTDLMTHVEDAFSGLRSSAQLFREVFFGVELPVDSPKQLVERAGGPDRLIRISYKESGPKALALQDILDAIPHFEELFPIKSFEKLANQLEKIREADPKAEAMWFVGSIKTTNLKAALNREARVAISREAGAAEARQVLVACGCCGELESPAKLLAEAFGTLTPHSGVGRWTGEPSSEVKTDAKRSRVGR